LQLTVRVIECTPEFVERNRNFVTTQGIHRADITMHGNMKLYENKDTSEEVRFILITGKDTQ
jgi:hypothetical protein